MTRERLRKIRFAYSGPTATWPLEASAIRAALSPETQLDDGWVADASSGLSVDGAVLSAPVGGDATGDRPLGSRRRIFDRMPEGNSPARGWPISERLAREIERESAA